MKINVFLKKNYFVSFDFLIFNNFYSIHISWLIYNNFIRIFTECEILPSYKFIFYKKFGKCPYSRGIFPYIVEAFRWFSTVTYFSMARPIRIMVFLYIFE